MAMIRAYHTENGVLPLFAGRVRSYLRVRYVVPSCRNTRLKRLFEERGAVARISRRHGCHLCKRKRPMPCRLVAWCFVGWFAAKYALNVGTRRPRFYYPHFGAFSPFRLLLSSCLFLWHSLFSLFCLLHSLCPVCLFATSPLIPFFLAFPSFVPSFVTFPFSFYFLLFVCFPLSAFL